MASHEASSSGIPDLTSADVRREEIKQRTQVFSDQLAAERPNMAEDARRQAAALMAIFDIACDMERVDQQGVN